MGVRILVTGATGRFGGIVPRLIARGHDVRAMTRRPDSPTAAALRRDGATVTAGDLDDATSLEEAMAGCDAVFASGTFHRAGPAGELRHGVALGEAVRAAGISHLVYVSGADAGPGTGVPILEVKGEVEARLRALNVPCSMIAPVYLMENLFNPWNLDALHHNVVRTFIEPTRTLQQVPVTDVVDFGVFVLEHRDAFLGQRVEIASDAVDAISMAKALERVTGQRFEIEHASPEALGPGLAALFAWLDRVGQHVDIAALRHAYPAVPWHRFEEWAASQFSPEIRTSA